MILGCYSKVLPAANEYLLGFVRVLELNFDVDWHE